jgi:hypothetical protein
VAQNSKASHEREESKAPEVCTQSLGKCFGEFKSLVRNKIKFVVVEFLLRQEMLFGKGELQKGSL